MADPVPASSLAGLIELADNPPLHLEQRLRRQNRLPLVMYIARVPGSRDVFLTNMKPRDKVVSAHDVESSLYYCHLETAEDEALRAEIDDEGVEQADESNAVEQAAPSQPHAPSSPAVPVLPAPVMYSSPASGAPRQPANGHSKISRKPIGNPPIAHQSAPVLPPRPLGPRPLEGPPGIHAGTNRPNAKENIRPPSYESSVKPPLPPRQGSKTSFDSAPPQTSFASPSQSSVSFESSRPPLPPRQSTSTLHQGPSSGTSPRPSRHSLLHRTGSISSATSPKSQRDFSLTLIRRDPGSGAQWNVGRMVRSATASPSEVAIELNGKGYAKYTQPDAAAAAAEAAAEPFLTTLSLRPSRAASPTAATSAPYSFMSPWDGQCMFATGVAGRSLRCRHVFPPHIADEASFAPRLALLNSAPVSELRLNLPVIGRRRKKKARTPSVGAGSRTPFLSANSSASAVGGGHRPSRSVDAGLEEEDDEDEWDDAEEQRMDLSLGREKAGGGFGGRKAKLGKIIVEGEGMLMLDLVVAANVAVWWAVAEGSMD